MQSIVVFCGSSKGENPLYIQAAKDLGVYLAKKGIKIVYGAGNVGLMGVLADAALAAGGEVIGVIPHFLKEKEVCHTELTQLFLVDSMYERKVKMAELSEGVIVLPGGYGTLDELFEMLTLVQLGQDNQPCGIWNVNGYFDHLILQLARMHQDKFLKDIHLKMLLVSKDLEDLMDQMQNWSLPVAGKWINR